MKKLVEQVEGEGLESLIGETVIIFCMNYFYAGKLTGVNEVDILLSDPSIVFQTGSFDSSNWEEEQRLVFTDSLYIRTASIEAYAKSK